MYILSVKLRVFLSPDSSVIFCTLLFINCSFETTYTQIKFMNIRKGNEPRADNLCIWKKLFVFGRPVVRVYVSVHGLSQENIYTL
jgi:hypothetical protein